MYPGVLPLTIVVVAYDMGRELPRTLRSLSVPYQRGIRADAFEIVVVDNGSPEPLDERLLGSIAPQISVHRIDDAPSSPAHAANIGIKRARGELVGLIIDGARMASPGLLAGARAAARVVPRPVVTAPAWHLGWSPHVRAAATNYDKAVEDEMLESWPWEQDGYELFEIATPAESSARGLFGPMGESSSLFMPSRLWRELDGLDERFALPGGGLVNHDLYCRACALGGAQLVVMLGEGTFHQIHGGAATSAKISREQMQDDYETIRGHRQLPPSAQPVYVGSVPRQYRRYLEDSLDLAKERARAAATYDVARPAEDLDRQENTT